MCYSITGIGRDRGRGRTGSIGKPTEDRATEECLTSSAPQQFEHALHVKRPFTGLFIEWPALKVCSGALQPTKGARTNERGSSGGATAYNMLQYLGQICGLHLNGRWRHIEKKAVAVNF